MLKILDQIKKGFIIITMIFFSFACNGNPKTTIEKIKIFYDYDEMFFYGHKEKDKFVEKGDMHEIENKKYISTNYREIVKNYLDKIDIFINSNFKLIREYYGWVAAFFEDNNILNKDDNRKRYLEVDAKLHDAIKDLLIITLPGVVRGMYAIDDIQYIEAAIEIEDGLFANTLDFEFDTTDQVYWTSYLLNSQPTKYKREDVLDKEGRMKYREWFYESNLKIRIVKQIRDEKGNYYGELYIDYYKLDEYDKLFDKDGNPKHPKDDAK